MTDNRSWHKGQIVLHNPAGRSGLVIGVDFEESLVHVDWRHEGWDGWSRMENLTQVPPARCMRCDSTGELIHGYCAACAHKAAWSPA